MIDNGQYSGDDILEMILGIIEDAPDDTLAAIASILFYKHVTIIDDDMFLVENET